MTKRPLHPRSLAAQALGKIDPLTRAVTREWRHSTKRGSMTSA